MSDIHGGFTAIGGYIYQILAVSEVQVSAAPGSEKGSKEDALLTMHEWNDQDGTMVSEKDKTVTFVQVKYSQAGAENKIPPAEFKEIVRRLTEAGRKADEKGWAINGIMLVSNRGLSSESQKIVADPSLGIEPVRETIGEDGEIKATEPKPWTEDHQAIASHVVDVILPYDCLLDELTKFASRYGVLPEELEERIKDLIAKVFLDVSYLKESGITLRHLTKILTGSADARSLIKSDQATIQSNELKAITGSTSDGHRHLPRDCTKNLFDNYPQYSLFVFHGKGGLGKTDSLEEFVREKIGKDLGPFIRAEAATRAGELWASQCSDIWRNVTPASPERSMDRAVERLQAANPLSKVPILLVALDGIDDELGSKAIEELRRLIKIIDDNFDPQAKRATDKFKLLITCRNLREFTPHLPPDPDAFEERPYKSYKPIEFKAFNPDEFRRIVLRDAERFKDALTPDAAVSNPSTTFSLELSGGDANKANSARYRYLRDPLVWRAFVSLPNALKEKVLNEEEQALRALGEKIYSRFIEKALRRKEELREEIDVVLSILKAVAIFSENFKGRLTRSEFIKAGSVKAGTETECGKVFREVLSAGLIDGDVEEWGWRYAAIPKYLKHAQQQS